MCISDDPPELDVTPLRQYMDRDIPGFDVTHSRHSPTVIDPETGKSIYKSTLVSLLNSDPHLSKDRLTLNVFVRFTVYHCL